MTSDQARKLLGGYATNSLTEAERKALFEAALDDQELFDALQQEEALKELLADPASRSQIQRALTQAPVPRPTAWWSRAWLWGGVAGAVAAAVLIVIAIRPTQQPKYQVARVAPPAPPTVSAEQAQPAAPAPAQPKPKFRKLTAPPPKPSDSALREPPAAASPPPPPTPLPASPPQPALAAAPRVQAFRQEQSAPADTLLRYFLTRRDVSGAYSVLPPNAPLQTGDSVKLNFSSALDGSLSLYQLDPSGNWKQVQSLRVAPNATATVPDSPILVTDMEQKFRLTLQSMDRMPLTLEITIAPGKVP
jgi:hypothetical protein